QVRAGLFGWRRICRYGGDRRELMVILLGVQPDFGSADLLLQGANVSLEQEQFHALDFALNLKPVDDVVFLPDFGALAGIAFLELFDGDLEAPRRNRKIRAL